MEKDVTKRGWPAPAWLCDFPEFNVRTYVTVGGKRGVWFLSLNATQPARGVGRPHFFPRAVFCRRSGAEMKQKAVHRATYSARRGEMGIRGPPGPGRTGRTGAARFVCRVGDGALLPPPLQLRAPHRPALSHVEVQHPKWRLQRGRIEIETNTFSEIPLGPDAPRSSVLSPARCRDVVARADRLNRRSLAAPPGMFAAGKGATRLRPYVRSHPLVFVSLSAAHTTSQPLSLST